MTDSGATDAAAWAAFSVNFISLVLLLISESLGLSSCDANGIVDYLKKRFGRCADPPLPELTLTPTPPHE